MIASPTLQLILGVRALGRPLKTEMKLVKEHPDLPPITEQDQERRRLGRIRLRELIQESQARRQTLMAQIGAAYQKGDSLNTVRDLECALVRERSKLYAYLELMDEVRGGLGERSSPRRPTFTESTFAALDAVTHVTQPAELDLDLG
jgi:hypothetical protein